MSIFLVFGLFRRLYFYLASGKFKSFLSTSNSMNFGVSGDELLSPLGYLLDGQMGRLVSIIENVYLSTKFTSRVVLPFMVSKTCSVVPLSSLSHMDNGTQYFVFMSVFPCSIIF